MDFMAGVMTGLSISALFGVLLLSGTLAAVTSRMKRLEESIALNVKKETWDDADYWKRGYENDDEI